MGRATVRAALQSFLSGIPGITTLYKDAPWELLGDNWQTNGLPGTPAFLHIDHTTESRVAMGGEHGGWKQVDYTVSLVLLYQYLVPSDLGGANKDVWVDNLDNLLDVVVTKIRSDRACEVVGGSPVFEAGNQDQGIQISHDLPHPDPGGGKVRNWVRVEFKVSEMVPA